MPDGARLAGDAILRRAAGLGSLNRVPHGPREQRLSPGSPTRGVWPRRFNELPKLDSFALRLA